MIDIIKRNLDWAEKFFKRFKAFGYIVAVLFAIVYFTSHGYNKKEAIRIAEKLTGLNLEKDILREEKINLKIERDSLYDELYFAKEQYDSILVLKEQAEWKSTQDKREKNDALRSLRLVTSDSSHIFNQTIAYPFSGKKEYGYNSLQVSEIHKTFIENEFNKDIINDQKTEIDHCNAALAMTENVENISDEVYKSFEEEIEVDNSIMTIADEIIDESMKQWGKERRKRIWGKIKTPAIAVGSFIFGIFIAK